MITRWVTGSYHQQKKKKKKKDNKRVQVQKFTFSNKTKKKRTTCSPAGDERFPLGLRPYKREVKEKREFLFKSIGF